MKRIAATLCAAAAFSAVPLGAMAQATVSSSDGNGYVNPVTWYDSGVYMGGNLRSASGDPVYFSGKMTYDNTTDGLSSRYTSDVTSTSYTARPGTIGSTASLTDKADGAYVRVCRNRNNLPDPCGSWSTKIYKP